MKFAALAVLTAGLSFAQISITDIVTMMNGGKSSQTIALSITASQGDGTKCTITKYSGNKIFAGFKCTPTDGTTVTNFNVTGGTNVQNFLFGFGDTLCFIILNPTSAAVTMGSFGTVAVNTLAWQCSTNITATGNQTPVVQGTVSWP